MTDLKAKFDEIWQKNLSVVRVELNRGFVYADTDVIRNSRRDAMWEEIKREILDGKSST